MHSNMIILNMKKTTTSYLIILLIGVFVFLFFFYLYPYHLYHREQTSIFILSQQTLIGYFKHPAVLSSLIGDFLTQFYYYQGIGPLIISISLVILSIIYYKLLQQINYWWIFIVMILLITWEFGKHCNLYYPISATFSLIGGGIMALLFIRSNLRFDKASIPFAFVCIALSYWLFGLGVWITLIFIIPCITWYIFIILAMEIIGISIYAKYIYIMPWRETFIYPAITLFDKPNFERERILKYDCEYYFNRLRHLENDVAPQGILPTYYTNLIDVKQQNLPPNLLTRMKYGINGLFIPVVPTTDPQSIYAANEVWFELGDMTLAEHATMLGMIFSPHNKGSRALRRLAEINLINQDHEAAKKYLRLLQKTIVHNKWATNRMPGQQSEDVKEWLLIKQNFLPKRDTIRSSDDIKTSLCNLLDANPNNLLALDYLLCYDLLTKNIDSFAYHIEKYGNVYSNHRLYQEAYLIYAMNLQNPLLESKNIHITPEVVDDFFKYTEYYQSDENHIDILKEKFNNTYWFYFHFAQRNK